MNFRRRIVGLLVVGGLLSLGSMMAKGVHADFLDPVMDFQTGWTTWSPQWGQSIINTKGTQVTYKNGGDAAVNNENTNVRFGRFGGDGSQQTRATVKCCKNAWCSGTDWFQKDIPVGSQGYLTPVSQTFTSPTNICGSGYFAGQVKIQAFVEACTRTDTGSCTRI